jgi:hypothetical protein
LKDKFKTNYMSIILSTIYNNVGNTLAICGNSVKWFGCNNVLLLLPYIKMTAVAYVMSSCSTHINLVSTHIRWFHDVNLSITHCKFWQECYKSVRVQSVLQSFGK